MAAREPNSPPKKCKHPSENEDDTPDFDIAPDPAKLRDLDWGAAQGHVAMLGMSRQLHSLLRAFRPTVIGSEPGPYRHTTISEVFSDYVIQNRQILVDSNDRGACQAHKIPELRAIVGRDRFLFSEMAAVMRRHLVLLDILKLS